jgi:hypothetical protein
LGGVTIRAYKRLTVALGIVVLALGIEALYLFIVVAKLQGTEIHTAKAVQSFSEAQDTACKADPTQAVRELQFMLDWKPVYYRSNSAHAFIIDHSRAQALSNVLSYLRKKTGEDLGDDPHAWIQRYQSR